jgi:hypothetical protein
MSEMEESLRVVRSLQLVASAICDIDSSPLRCMSCINHALKGTKASKVGYRGVMRIKSQVNTPHYILEVRNNTGPTDRDTPE